MESRVASLDLALIHEVFFDPRAEDLDRRLAEARERGAELAVLPELALDPWFPASRERRPGDAEEPGGPRHRRLSAAARRAGIGLLGGAVIDLGAGKRVNRALLFDREGNLAASYDKLHLPSEEGFWEADHYGTGSAPPRRIDAFGLPLGLQVCSDLNRPVGCHLLGAQGAAAILAPRATEPSTYDRWLTVMRANALTSTAYVVSVNRPRPEPGVPLGGPSVVVTPDGEVLLETEEPVTVARLEAGAVARARTGYPGYMGFRPELYAEGWRSVAGEDE